MKKIWLAVMAAVILAGCASAPSTLSVDGASQRVLFNDNGLSSKIDIEQIDSEEVNDHVRGGLLLTSKISNDQTIEYRFYWYNDNGLEVSKPAPWKRKIIRGYETTSISEVSVNPNGTQYRVQIREAD
ncbi:DUF1425 domain-containing protein [Vibrio sp. SCSIO 43136]|uniref:YcfL family protein n=1 Tax=Vibrio sp. SCSIO 43136 TaxID=2819101 RepID=UPI002076181C|nr:DUF1425 domain-containing protein [Vibrio sp. SCSIO 43136]USD66195.1 DUF1425 domain-containing protein [Vibrio sp. SCSIO 43136]